jgi:putative transposase
MLSGRSVTGMVALVSALLSWLAGRFHSRAELELEVIALRHHLAVLHRHRPGRHQLFELDRLFWIWCLNIIVLVKQATVVQWRRQGFRLSWRWRSRSGRPSVDREVRDLIRHVNSANPLWGAPRIHGESLEARTSTSAKPRSQSTWCDGSERLRQHGAVF